MTTEQAKEILAAFRPGTDDEQDPIFAEALELMRSDKDLKAWFEEARAFDQLMKVELARVPAPASVREVILASPKIIRPAPWWNPRLKGWHWAAAAAVLIFAAGLALWFGHQPVTFGEFRREIADQSWGPAPHVEHKAANMVEVRRSLDERHLPSKFPVPPILARSGVRGYTLMHWRGHEMPVLCFHSEGQHLHLTVVDRHLFPDAPLDMPEIDKWEAWRTASWSYDDFSYVLTGLNVPTFVKKFRKSKRWDWDG
jgi:hypothetical protein